MKKIILTVCGFLISLTSAYSATGIFGSHVEIWDGTTSTIYRGESFGSAPDFQGADFGSFELTDTLLIGNSQVNTFKNSGGNVTGAELQYQVYKTSLGSGSFSTHTFSFGANAPTTDIAGNSITGTDDQTWGNPDDIDLLSLATSGNGEYTVEIFFRAFTNEGDRFSNNGGSNFTSTFEVVPEPSTFTLLALAFGSLTFFRRRR